VRILSFDTSTNEIHLSLVEAGRALKEMIVAEADSQTRQEAVAALMPSVVDLMAKGGWRKGDLDCIVVGEGPGSFTGVRTGIVTARTMAQALHLPLVPVNLLDCYASVIPAPAAVVLSAGRGRYFVAGYMSPDNFCSAPTPTPFEVPVPSSTMPQMSLPRQEPVVSEPAISEPATSVPAISEPATSVPPTSVSADELGPLMAEFATWYLDEKALSELSGKQESLASERNGHGPQLESLPILENIATKQAQIAWNRVSLKLAEANQSGNGLSNPPVHPDLTLIESHTLRDLLLQAYPYQSVTPLYLRSPSITMKKPASEKPHGS
jgi:tRNA threonylcarbamoyl adenosine modification protein YeaZ